MRALETGAGAAGASPLGAFRSCERRTISLSSALPAALAGRITAVTLNLTAVNPTGAGCLTAWPSGTSQPATSSLSDWLGPIREATPLPDGLVGAVAINVTVTNAEGDGYITFYPGDEVPPTSSINFSAGTTVANTVLVGTDNIGNVNFHIESTGPIDVIVDVTGWYPQDTFGLIAEARFARYYGTGVDRVGVIVCESPEHRIDPATVMSNLNTYVVPWFARSAAAATASSTSTSAR